MSVIVLLDTAIQIFIAIAVVSLITAFVLFGLSGRLTFFKFKKNVYEENGKLKQFRDRCTLKMGLESD